MTASISTQTLADLRQRLGATLIAPGDPAYESERLAWNRVVDQHPAVIVLARDAQDVRTAVQAAAAYDLPVAVQTTGHGVVRGADGAMLVVLAALKQVQVDPAARTARVGGGAKWADVLEHCTPHGLAPLLGSTPDVGVAGYTLGGGLGWLGRKYGMACDSVNWFELVTANGEISRASASENPDLFWALRGGGGGFGVVTELEIQLFPVAEVYGGNLFYPPELAAEVFARYRAWIAAAPDELTSSVVLMNFPPVPALPDFLRGKSFVLIRGAYTGAAESGEKLLDYWRAWRPPLIDDFKRLPFSQVAAISNDPVDPLPGTGSGGWLNDLSDETAAVLIRSTLPQNGPPALIFVEVRHTGGAIAAVDPAQTAYSHRQEQLVLYTVAMTPTPEIRAAARAHIDEMRAALGNHMSQAVYMNFLDGEEARRRTPDGFSPAAFTRLQLVKAAWDPSNRFNHSYMLVSE